MVEITARKETILEKRVNTPNSSEVYNRLSTTEIAKGISCDIPDPNIKTTTFFI